MLREQEPEDEWPDVITADQFHDKPLALMSSDELLACLERECEDHDRFVEQLKEKVLFWREISMVFAGALIVYTAWLIFVWVKG